MTISTLISIYLIQMFLIPLDRHYINVLGYLSALGTCPPLSHMNVLLVPHLVCLHLDTVAYSGRKAKTQQVLVLNSDELRFQCIHVDAT